MSLGLSRRATEFLEWLEAEKGGDDQLNFEPTALAQFVLGDVSLFGPIQSRCQNWVHGTQPAQGVGNFNVVKYTAGPKGGWVSHFSTGGLAYRIQFATLGASIVLGTSFLASVSREDQAVPGLIPTVVEPLNFGESQYGPVNPMPQGGILEGGSLVAPLQGALVANAIILYEVPIYVPPLAAVAACGITANNVTDIQFRVVESLGYFGRNFGDRQG